MELLYTSPFCHLRQVCVLLQVVFTNKLVSMAPIYDKYCTDEAYVGSPYKAFTIPKPKYQGTSLFKSPTVLRKVNLKIRKCTVVAKAKFHEVKINKFSLTV